MNMILLLVKVYKGSTGSFFFFLSFLYCLERNFSSYHTSSPSSLSTFYSVVPRIPSCFQAHISPFCLWFLPVHPQFHLSSLTMPGFIPLFPIIANWLYHPITPDCFKLLNPCLEYFQTHALHPEQFPAIRQALENYFSDTPILPGIQKMAHKLNSTTFTSVLSD